MARRITAVADSETDPFEHGRVPEPFIWGLFDGRKYYEFSSTDEFVTHIKDRPYDLYAHNGGKYDWHFPVEPHRTRNGVPGNIRADSRASDGPVPIVGLLLVVADEPSGV